MPKSVKLTEKLPWKYKWYALGIAVWVISHWPLVITEYYTNYIFKPFSNALRLITSSFPFAIGELVYLLIIIILIINSIEWLMHNKNEYSKSIFWKTAAINCFNIIVKLFVIFELFWGLNYQKMPPSKEFQLTVSSNYTESQMDSLSLELIKQLNNTRLKMGNFDPKYMNFDSILSQNRAELDKNAQKWPFLKYKNPSLKKALFPIWGDYIGYTAFYQPLTGEAIVRDDLPKLLWPFTMSHEIAHQLGYASEDQANFVAFIIGVESDQPLFNYAAQLQLFTYAQYAHLNFIAQRGDYNLYKAIVSRNKNLLNPTVIADRMEIKSFFQKKQAKQIKGSEEMYNQFLIWNKQQKGIESYQDVLLWVLSYQSKKNP